MVTGLKIAGLSPLVGSDGTGFIFGVHPQPYCLTFKLKVGFFFIVVWKFAVSVPGSAVAGKRSLTSSGRD